VNEFLSRCHYFSGQYNSAQSFAEFEKAMKALETAAAPEYQVQAASLTFIMA
jgi:glucose-6-phosphate 1-dehydrogenase